MLSRLRAAAIGIWVLGAAPTFASAQAASAPAPSDPTDGATPAPAKPVAPSTATPAAPATGGPPAASKPTARRRRRPMYEAIEKAVDEVMRRHYDPCATALQRGVPCFPTGIEVEGMRYSVADSMRKYRPDGSRAEGAAITHSDMREQMGGAPLSDSGGVSVDPVCTVKSLIRRMSGNGKFYLYRLSDGQQERPVLTDRKIDLAVHASNPEARYEYLGEYSGECEAIAAWRKQLRESVAPPPVDDTAAPGSPGAPAGAAEVPPPEDEITIRDRTSAPSQGGSPPP